MKKRRKYSPELKAQVAIEAIKGEKTISQIASEFNVHPMLVNRWKKQFLESSYKVFSNEGNREKELQRTIDELYKQIGQLKVERDFLSRKLGLL
jgi:transposase